MATLLLASLLLSPPALAGERDEDINIEPVDSQFTTLNLDDCLYLTESGDEVAYAWSVDVSLNANTNYSVEMGNSCTIEGDDGCLVLDYGTVSGTASGTFSFFPYEVIGETCPEVASGSTLLWVILDEPEGGSVIEDGGTSTTTGGISSASYPLQYDTMPPYPPEITQISAGEGSLRVYWEVSDLNEGEEMGSYMLYWSTGEILPGDASTSSYEVTGEENYQITELDNDVVVNVALTAIDAYGNESALSESMAGTPVPVDDFYEYYRRKGGGEVGQFCFIATAAYGTYDHRYVRALRQVRDRYLLTSPWGQRAVSWYYEASPPLADFIRAHPSARGLAQAALVPLVVLALALVDAPPTQQALALVALLLYFHLMRRGLIWMRRRLTA